MLIWAFINSSANLAFKTNGSRSLIFADLNIYLNDEETFEESLEFNIQQTSKNTYFRQYSIDTALVSSENTNLEN